MLKWQLKIVGPRCAGRYLFRNNMIASPENVKWLKNDLAACGMDVQSLRLSDLPNRLALLALVAVIGVSDRVVTKRLLAQMQMDLPAIPRAALWFGGDSNLMKGGQL